MTWWLRKEDGTVYGPVDEDTLCRWAADGRVLPEDQASTDNEHWQPAPALDVLGMDWTIELANGAQYGPLHLLAMAELIRDGAASGGEQVVHRTTRETHRLSDVLVQALAARAAELQAAVDEAAAGAAEPPASPADSEWKQRYEAERDERAASEQELNEQVRRLGERELELLKRVETAELRVRHLEQQVAAPPLPGVKIDAGAMDERALLQSYNDLSRNYERILQQVREKQEELKALTDARSKSEQDTNARLAAIEEAAARDRLDATQLRQRLADSEKAHLEIVQAYRDLNDRYIRLRQQGNGTTPSPAAPGNAPPKAGGDKPRVRLV